MLRLSPASGHPIRAFGIVGWSGAGKTTLIEHLLAQFASWGLSVSVIKHAHHGFDIDRPGKDSWRHREAGATEVMLVSDQRWVLMHELRIAPDNLQTAPAAQPSVPDEPDLGTLLSRLAPCDFVLVEGYKESHIPKIEVYRCDLGKPRFQGGPRYRCGCDRSGRTTRRRTTPLNDPQTIARFILTHLDLTAPLASTVLLASNQ